MSPKLLNTIKELYNLNSLDFKSQADSGCTNLSFVLDSEKGKVLLKQYIYQEKERIETIHRIKEFLSNNQMPTVLPQKNHIGNTYFQFENKFYGLFPYVLGISYKVSDIPKQALQSTAGMLAQIHLLSKNTCPEITNRIFQSWDKKLFFKALEPIEKVLAAKPTKNHSDILFKKYIEQKIKIVETNKIYFEDLHLKCDHLTHGDYQLQNLLFNEQNQVKYIFDLEIARIAPRIIEIIRAISLICFDANFNESNFHSARTFLQIYHEIYPLTKEEISEGIKAYFFSTLVYTTWLEERHYLNSDFRATPLIEKKIATLDYFSNNIDDFTNKLTNTIL